MAYRTATSIEHLLASEALPSLARLYASDFFPRYAALTPESFVKLAIGAGDHRAYARFACLVQHQSPVENEILKAFLLFVSAFSMPLEDVSHNPYVPYAITEITEKIMQDAIVTDGNNATASLRFGRDLIASTELSGFFGIAAHEMGHNLQDIPKFRRTIASLSRPDGEQDDSGQNHTTDGLPSRATLSASDHIPDPCAAIAELPYILGKLKVAAIKSLSTPLQDQDEDERRRDTTSHLRVLFTINELPEGFLHQISISDCGAALPLETGAAHLYAIVELLGVASAQMALA